MGIETSIINIHVVIHIEIIDFIVNVHVFISSAQAPNTYNIIMIMQGFFLEL